MCFLSCMLTRRARIRAGILFEEILPYLLIVAGVFGVIGVLGLLGII